MTEVTIKVRENGPYRVTGPFRCTDTDGNAYELPEGDTARALPLRPLGDEAVLRQDAPEIGFDATERAAR